jgi:hypothetical protein
LERDSAILIENPFPDYFGGSEFPKIMGYSMAFTMILAIFGAPIAGFIRDFAGSHIFRFRPSVALMAIAFFCIVFAASPCTRP